MEYGAGLREGPPNRGRAFFLLVPDLKSLTRHLVAGFQDAWMTAQNHFHDIHSYHPNYMIAPEVTHEFNLLNDFLHTGLLDDGSGPSDESQQSPAFRRSSQPDMVSGFGNNNSLAASGQNQMSSNNMSGGSMLPPPPNLEGRTLARPGSVVPADKAREYYLQAADPSGNDTPEERMARVLKAKYDAGLLKPFNYIKGYARLGTYLDSHIAPSSKQKILRTINSFRPKFREKAHALTDMELVYVEMWFEKQLMDYDRVFASMAVPACCWRRTGEIFRGNKEMAELIGVSVVQLRDVCIGMARLGILLADFPFRARLRCTRFLPKSQWFVIGKSLAQLPLTQRMRRYLRRVH